MLELNTENESDIVQILYTNGCYQKIIHEQIDIYSSKSEAEMNESWHTNEYRNLIKNKYNLSEIEANTIQTIMVSIITECQAVHLIQIKNKRNNKKEE